MTGIQVRHTRGCRSNEGGACNCERSYRAWVGTKIRKTFKNQAEAKSWRSDAVSQLNKGTMSVPSKVTVREAGDALIEGIRSGAVRNKRGRLYKPSAVRGYKDALQDRIYPALGPVRLSEIQRRDVQRLVNDMQGEGLSASTIKNTIMPLRVIYRLRVEDGELAVSPCDNLRMPASDEKERERIGNPEEAAALIAALPDRDHALWAVAFYAGLRSGELQALEWDAVDLEARVIHVRRSYDPKAHEFIEPKSKAGKRKVPIPNVLRAFLLAHKMRSEPSVELVFPRRDGGAFTPTAVRGRALTAWRCAKLEPIALHEARHTFASLMIAAGVNAKSLSEYMGHASIAITYDRYGHLMPGNLEEAAVLFDAYIERSAGQKWASEGQ